MFVAGLGTGISAREGVTNCAPTALLPALHYKDLVGLRPAAAGKMGKIACGP